MIIVEYSFSGIIWHTYKETNDAYEAKMALKALKKCIGKEGKARIRKV